MYLHNLKRKFKDCYRGSERCIGKYIDYQSEEFNRETLFDKQKTTRLYHFAVLIHYGTENEFNDTILYIKDQLSQQLDMMTTGRTLTDNQVNEIECNIYILEELLLWINHPQQLWEFDRLRRQKRVHKQKKQFQKNSLEFMEKCGDDFRIDRVNNIFPPPTQLSVEEQDRIVPLFGQDNYLKDTNLCRRIVRLEDIGISLTLEPVREVIDQLTGNAFQNFDWGTDKDDARIYMCGGAVFSSLVSPYSEIRTKYINILVVQRLIMHLDLPIYCKWAILGYLKPYLTDCLKECHSNWIRYGMIPSDIDLFITANSIKAAERKIVQTLKYLKSLDPRAQIYRTYNTFSIHPSTSHIPITIILSVYRSLDEILVSFDLDCCCVGYDGHQVYAHPRYIHSLQTGENVLSKQDIMFGSRRTRKYQNKGIGFQSSVLITDLIRIDKICFDQLYYGNSTLHCKNLKFYCYVNICRCNRRVSLDKLLGIDSNDKSVFDVRERGKLITWALFQLPVYQNVKCYFCHRIVFQLNIKYLYDKLNEIHLCGYCIKEINKSNKYNVY